jgi:hypothetical protein
MANRTTARGAPEVQQIRVSRRDNSGLGFASYGRNANRLSIGAVQQSVTAMAGVRRHTAHS